MMMLKIKKIILQFFQDFAVFWDIAMPVHSLSEQIENGCQSAKVVVEFDVEFYTLFVHASRLAWGTLRKAKGMMKKNTMSSSVRKGSIQVSLGYITTDSIKHNGSLYYI